MGLIGTTQQVIVLGSTGGNTGSIVRGPSGGVSTNNAVATWNGTSANAIQSTGATMAASGNLLTFAGASTLTDNGSGGLTIAPASGQTATITKQLNLTAGTASISTTTGTAVITGGLGVSGTGNFAQLAITNTTAGLSVLNFNNTAVNTGNRNWLIGQNQIVYGDLSFYQSTSSGAVPSVAIVQLTANGISVPLATATTSVSGGALNVNSQFAINGTNGNVYSNGTIATGAGATAAAQPWNLGGIRTSTGLVVSTTQVVQVSINGTLVSLSTCTTNP